MLVCESVQVDVIVVAVPGAVHCLRIVWSSSADIPSPLSVCFIVTERHCQAVLSTESAIWAHSDSFLCYFCASFKVISCARRLCLRRCPFSMASCAFSGLVQFVQCLVSSGVMPCRSRQRERRHFAQQREQRCFTVALQLHFTTFWGTRSAPLTLSHWPTRRSNDSERKSICSWRPHAFAARLSSTLLWLSLRSP